MQKKGMDFLLQTKGDWLDSWSLFCYALISGGWKGVTIWTDSAGSCTPCDSRFKNCIRRGSERTEKAKPDVGIAGISWFDTSGYYPATIWWISYLSGDPQAIRSSDHCCYQPQRGCGWVDEHESWSRWFCYQVCHMNLEFMTIYMTLDGKDIPK